MERELRVRFTGDAGDLRRAAGDAERAMRQAEKAHRDGAISAAELGRQLGTLAAAYVSLSSAAAVAQRGLQGLASMEQSTLTFKVLFQDADRAKAKMQELAQFAAKTPFELPGIVDAAKALETFGLNSSKYLKDAGDLAAAFGVEINEVARAFGRINSGDFGEAFERLRDFGIARKDLEGEGLVFDKSGSYQGSVEQALTAVQAIIRRKFGGMMEEQSQTFTGQMSNLADNVQTMLNKAFAQPFDAIKGKVTELNGSIDGELGNRLDNLATLFGDNMYNSLLGIIPVAEGFGNILLTSAEKANEVLGGVAAISAKAGADSARKDMLKQGIGGIQGLNTVQRVALQATSHHSLDDMLLTSRALGVSEQAKGQLVQLYLQTQQMAEKAADEQFIESYQSRVGAIKATLQPKKSPLKNTGGTGGGSGGSSADGPAPRVADGIGGVYGPAFDYGFKFFGPADGSDYLKFQEVQGKQTEDLGARIERETMAYVRQQEQARKDAERLAVSLGEKAEASLRGGLEAGVSLFLDGGIGNLGDATYSLSKNAFSDALVDGVMNSDLKDAFGGLGQAFSGPLTAGLAAVALGALEIKKSFDEIETHSQRLEDQRKRYVTGMGPNEDLRSLVREREGYRRSVENPAPRWMLWAGGHNDAVRGKLSTYDSFLPDAAKSVFNSGFDESKALNLKSLDEALAYTHTQVLRFADANELSVDITNGLLAAKTEETKAAYRSAKAAEAFADSLGSYGGLMKSFDWIERLGGGKMDATDLKYAGLAATGGGLDISRIDQQEAVRLAELYGLMQYGGDEGASQYSVGMNKPKTSREQIVEILGYDPGRNEHGDKLVTMLEQMILPMLAQRQEILGGSAAAGIGSLSNPDQALSFDAPAVRNVHNTNHVTVNTYAITGDKASTRDLARILMAEMETIRSQAV